MKVVDLNILLYAVNRNAPLHKAATKWCEAALNDEEPVGLPWVSVGVRQNQYQSQSV